MDNMILNRMINIYRSLEHATLGWNAARPQAAWPLARHASSAVPPLAALPLLSRTRDFILIITVSSDFVASGPAAPSLLSQRPCRFMLIIFVVSDFVARGPAVTYHRFCQRLRVACGLAASFSSFIAAPPLHYFSKQFGRRPSNL